jgi:DNA-nicking Smr family endonuclease
MSNIESDEDFWEQEISDVRPLPTRHKTNEAGKSDTVPLKPSAKKPKLTDDEFIDLSGLNNPQVNFKNVNTLPYDKPTPTLKLNNIDASLLRQLKLNRDIIQYKIDLHDMTQAEAYSSLRIFLQNARNNGAKIVLIITGKGSKGDIGELRRNLPRWCIEPNFGNIVVGIRQAYKHHGGEGAVYLQLKKI